MLYFDPRIGGPRIEPQSAEASKDARQRAALRQLEGEFLKTLFSEMRKSVTKGGIFPENFASQTQREMLDEALAFAAADSGQFGIAKQMEAEIKAHEAALKARGKQHAAMLTQVTHTLDSSAAQNLPITSTAQWRSSR